MMLCPSQLDHVEAGTVPYPAAFVSLVPILRPSWLDQPAAPHVYVSYRYRARGDSALAAKFHQAVRDGRC